MRAIYIECIWEKYAYGDEEAVEVSGLAVVHVGGLAEHLRKASETGDAQNVDVVIAAERLEKREVNLQSDIILVFFICCQNAQHHTVWISVDQGTCDQSPVCVLEEACMWF